MLLVLLYSVFRLLLDALVHRRCSDASLRLELLVLWHQLRVVERQVKRPRWRSADRLTLAGLSRRLPRPSWGSASSSAPRPCCAGIAVRPKKSLFQRAEVPPASFSVRRRSAPVANMLEAALSSADFQRLLEFCSLTDTLIVDADGILQSLPLQRPAAARPQGDYERG